MVDWILLRRELALCLCTLTMAALLPHLAWALPPTADPGGPYTAEVGASVDLDGTDSFDPEGGALTFEWEFGDGNTASGAQPSHVFASSGTFTVTLTVTDPELLQDDAATTANVVFADTVSVVPISSCITVADTCRTVSVRLDRGNAIGARGISVTFGLSPELRLCDTTPSISINQGDWLSGFEPNIFFAAHDNGDGTFTVDQSILGAPCGATGGGILFTVDVRKAPGVIDATGTITVDSVMLSDCGSTTIPATPGDSGSIEIDTTLPPSVTGIRATEVANGNDGDGTTQITVTFDAPSPDVATVEVWRAPYGNYPEYDDPPNAGSAPLLPTLYPPTRSDPRWQLTTVSTSGQTDEPTTRDYWYYIAIGRDACGNPAPAVTLDGALDYHRGDVTPTESPGNNRVDFFDISRLGTCYFGILDPNDPCGDADVAPMPGDGPPATDNLVNFEDLLVFAMNFEQVSLLPPTRVVPSTTDDRTPQLTLRLDRSRDGRVQARLDLTGNASSVRGFHVAIDLAGMQLVDVDRGKLLDEQAAEVFFAHQPGQIVLIDAAVLGEGQAIIGNGTVATIELAGLGNAGARLTEVDIRDVDGRPFGHSSPGEPAEDTASDAAAAPTRFTLLGARPNPFNPSTTIRFQLPGEMRVELRIYDVSGHLVRTLTDDRLAAGEHAVEWNGRDSEGRAMSSGVYIYAIQAGGVEVVEKLLMVR